MIWDLYGGLSLRVARIILGVQEVAPQTRRNASLVWPGYWPCLSGTDLCVQAVGTPRFLQASRVAKVHVI